MSLWTATCHIQVEAQRQRDLELVDESSCALQQSKQMPTLFQSSEKGSIKCETGKWEAFVTNDSIGTCSSDLYIDYSFETSGTASCGTTGIYIRNYIHIIS